MGCECHYEGAPHPGRNRERQSSLHRWLSVRQAPSSPTGCAWRFQAWPHPEHGAKRSCIHASCWLCLAAGW